MKHSVNVTVQKMSKGYIPFAVDCSLLVKGLQASLNSVISTTARYAHFSLR